MLKGFWKSELIMSSIMTLSEQNPCDKGSGRKGSERLYINFSKAAWLLLLLVFPDVLSICARADPQQRESPIFLKSVNLVDVEGGRLLSGVDVLVADGRVKKIGHHLRIPRGAKRVFEPNAFLIPGLWDMHVHIAGLSADPEWSRNVLLPLLIANGVTGVRDMGGNLAALQQWRDEVSHFAVVGPRLVFAGPMLDGESDDPSVISVKTSDQARDTVDRLAAQHVDFIKVLSGLDRDSYFAAVAESKAQGLPIVGHVPTVIGTAEASRAGQKSIEHILYGGFAIACSGREEALRQDMISAMRSGAIREVAKVEDAAFASFSEEKAQKLWETLRQNQTWVVPTLVATFVNSHLDELSVDNPELEYLPQAVRNQWIPEKLSGSLQPDKLEWWKREFSEEVALVRRMHEAHIALLAGTDSLDTDNVVGFALARELELLVQAGFTPIQALQAATIRPAEFLGRTDIGSIAEGKVADLVILTANPLANISNIRTIESVIVRGRYLSRSDLDQMLKAIRLREPTR